MNKIVEYISVTLFVIHAAIFASCSSGLDGLFKHNFNWYRFVNGNVIGVELDLSRTVTTLAGDVGTPDYVDGALADARFNYPSDIITDRTFLYVVDTDNHAVRKIDQSSNTVSTFAGNGSEGTSDGIGGNARFSFPQGLTTNGTYIYLCDEGNNSIRRIAIATGDVTTIAGTVPNPGSADGFGTSAGFDQPCGIALCNGFLYVLDSGNHTIRKINIQTTEVTTMCGQVGAPGTADGIGTSAQFRTPEGIATDGVYLYVTDNENHTIRKVVIATAEVSTIAGDAGNSGTDNGIGAAALFDSPEGICTDGFNLYVSEWWNHSVRKIDPDTKEVSTLVGLTGTPGSADGIGTAARFRSTDGICTDGTVLYVTDTDNHTIRKVE